MKQTSIRLCCGRKGGCPVVKSEEGKIKIEDDYGNEITITQEEARELGSAVDKLLK